MFKLTPEGRQRVDGNNVVRQTVPEFGSSNRESPTANSRQLDLWHHKTIGASLHFSFKPKCPTKA